MRRKKMTEDALLTVLSEKSSVNSEDTARVWAAVKGFISEGINASPQRALYVPGMGTFSRKAHKGHPLNLNLEGGRRKIDDYEVIRFKADPAFKSAVLSAANESIGFE